MPIQFQNHRAGNHDLLIPPAAVSGDFVFVGSQTPHDLERGRLVTRIEELDADLVAIIPSDMVISDVPEARIRAQTLMALKNLRLALESAGSSFKRLVALRMFLRDRRDIPSAVDVVHRALGADLPSATVIETNGPNVDPDIDIQIDALALSRDSGFELRHFVVPELVPLHRPFPTATFAGPFLFTSTIAGCDPATRRPATLLSELTAEERGLADEYYVSAAEEALVAEQLMLWRNHKAILAAAGIPFENVLHQNNWLRISMQQYVPVTRVRRNVFGLDRGRTAATSLPVSNLRTPAAHYECSLIAVRPGFEKQGFKKEIGIGSHGVGPYYLGATRAGRYVFAAGEVAIDTSQSRPRMVERAADLSGGLRHLHFGRNYREIPLVAQSHCVYELIAEGLANYGCTFADVAHQTVYLVDVGDFAALERIAVSHFGGRLPPTTIVPILGASPFRENLLEIEVTAVAPR